jgi:6-phosphogluconolactonase/glucosamine-6-phosphate isomerase/deaminase
VINPVLPFVLYIISLVFKLVSLIFIDERNFEKSNEKTNSRQIKNAFIEMKNKPDVFLFSILLIIFI